MSMIYLAQWDTKPHEKLPHFKIGRSADVTYRMGQLRYEVDRPIRLLGAFLGGKKEEALIHEELVHLRAFRWRPHCQEFYVRDREVIAAFVRARRKARR
jgi:hypothetical protein